LLILKPLLKVFVILILGIIPSIWIIQNDSNVRKFFFTKIIQILEESWYAKIELEDFDLNLFTSSIYLKKGEVKFLCSSGCSWKYEYCRVQLSKIFSLIKNKMYLNLIFDDLEIRLSCKKDDILNTAQKHMTDVFSTSSDELITKLNTVTINNLKVNLSGFDKNLFMDLPGTFVVKEFKRPGQLQKWDIFCSVYEGAIFLGDLSVIQSFNGNFKGFYKADINSLNVKVNGDFKLTNQDNLFLLNGEINNSEVQINLNTNDGSIDTKLTSSGEIINLQGYIDGTQFKNICDSYENFVYPNNPIQEKYGFLEKIKGKLNLDLFFTLSSLPLFQGKARLTNVFYNDYAIDQVDLDLANSESKLKLDTNINKADLFEFQGKAEWGHKKQNGALYITNKKPISNFGQDRFFVKERDFKLKVNFDSKCILQGEFFIAASRKDGVDTFKTKGDLCLKDNKLLLKGKTAFADYLIMANLIPNAYLTKFLYFKGKEKFIDLDVDEKSNKYLIGKIKSSFVGTFLPHEYKRLFLVGDKSFELKISQDSFSDVQGALVFEEGQFYLPNSYNLIEKLNVNFFIDVPAKKLLLKDFELQFHKGIVHCQKAYLQFKDNFELLYINAPLNFDDVLINWGKDFYGFIYGNLLFDKRVKKHLKIIGDLVLKKSVLKDNPLSKESVLDSFEHLEISAIGPMDIEYDIDLSNEEPINIYTNFLKAKSNFDLNLKLLQLQNRSQVTQVVGDIDIEKGELNFLSNKLYINYGKIQFMPNQMNDPAITLIAKNKIKKYFIIMRITGSLQNPKVVLESTPELTEEQILALLMAGSESASFQTDLPAILMHNLTNWVMERKDVLSKTKGFFKKVMLPFKYVQITPNFTDQSGRGGVKGIISIDLNKQLHAQVQKNFNLQEDFEFQVEYFLTDDINLKAIKDQRGELGVETEVRFKF